MSSFPQWAQPWLAGKSNQVSHGLNLVLELKDPTSAQLPQMLWDIVLAQDKITLALESLSFVHFARFIPSWDGRALMVITEFDGPLDPYVLDFVIALGDVFDTLLSYVKEPPDKMPVREYPDEFLAWVRKWNRVPFLLRTELTLLPEGFDYPVYSAYPEKTVTDIVGPRLLPPPALNHPAAAVDPTDVQGNILRGYGAKHGRYLFFSVSDAVAARRWLAKDLPEEGAPWRGVASAATCPTTRPEVFTQVAFTFDGLQKLLPSARLDGLKCFPQAFREGAAARAEGNFDQGHSAPNKWLFGRPDEPVHVVLFLYTTAVTAPAAFLEAVAVLETGRAQGLKFLRTLTGNGPDGAEPFGFAEGLSDPAISGQCAGAEPAFQPSASPGEFLLHAGYKSIYGGTSLGAMPPDLASNGSFGVLRLMEQDVELFKQSTADEAKRLGVEPERLRAKIVGRWENGAPLALAPDNKDQAGAVNAFDYGPSWEFPNQFDDHDGLRCPVGAHIRRANPRSARVAGQAHARRLLRRGMPAKWKDADGQTKVGLMGLFLGASIEQQFEFIQRQWLQGDLAASGVRGTTDVIAAIRTESTDFSFLEPDPDCPKVPRRLVARIPPLVQTRGCLYLFFPGLSALKVLDAADAQEAVKALAVLAAAKAAAFKQALEKAALGTVGAASKAVVGAVDCLGGLFAVADQVASAAVSGGKLAIAKAVESFPVVGLYLPGLDIRPFLLNTVPKLEDLLAVPALQTLAGGKWVEIVRALVDRTLDSKLVQQVIESFAPPPPIVAAEPPAGMSVVDFNLTDPRFRANPYAALRQLREVDNKRIVWVPAQQACWVLGHEDCKDLLARHPHFMQTPSNMPLRGIVTLDQDRHTKVRTAYAAAFSLALATMEKNIEPTVKEVVTRLRNTTHLRQFDFMQDFAHPTARTVVWQLIGITDKAEQQSCDALANTLVLRYGKTASPHAVGRFVAADAGLRLAARLAVPLSVAWITSSSPIATK